MLMEKASRLHLLLLALLMTIALPGVSFAQDLKVRGCVTDEQNEPLVGVSVQTKNKSFGTVTDIDGNYVLSGVPQGSVLVFSYVGYKPKEVTVTSATINVVLDENTEQLDEMVVIGYGQQRKVTLTGSVANVGGKELLKSPAASLGNALSGKLPGLQSVQYSGVPGADDPIIRIRGIGSFNSADPLVLVDGVEREFSQIDPNDKGLGGIQRRKALIDSIRGAEKNVLLVDAGDAVQGTLFFTLYKGEAEMKMMDALGYDLAILGNHDFDNGMDDLKRNVSSTPGIQWLSTNYEFDDPQLDSIFAPYKIYDIDGRRIAFIGINLDPKGMIADGNYDGVRYLDGIKAANATAWSLKHNEKADAVIAVTHVGYDEVPPSDRMIASQ